MLVYELISLTFRCPDFQNGNEIHLFIAVQLLEDKCDDLIFFRSLKCPMSEPRIYCSCESSQTLLRLSRLRLPKMSHCEGAPVCHGCAGERKPIFLTYSYTCFTCIYSQHEVVHLCRCVHNG